MIDENYLAGLPFKLKWLIGVFVVVLSIGFISGLSFVKLTTAASPSGIVENYLGNEDDQEAAEMKFKKSQHEILNIIHTHILSMSIIFFLLGGLVFGCQLPAKLKLFLMIEPLMSVLLTFGGIYLIWEGYTWCTFVVMISGALMTISFLASVSIILIQLLKKN